MGRIRSVVLPALVGKRRDDIGGVASFLIALETRLRDAGLAVEMLGYGPDTDRDEGFRPILNRPSPRGRDLTYALWTHRNRWTFAEDTVVHLQRSDQALGFLKGPWPMVVSFHGWHRRTVDIRQGRLAGMAYGLLQRRVARRADALVFVTRHDHDGFLREYPQHVDKAHHVPIGIDRDRFRVGDRGAARGAMGFPGNTTVLLYLGRLEPEKNVGALVDAVERLPGVELWIGGKGSEEDALRRAAGPRVRFLGFLTGDDVSRALVACDALVMASHHEGLPTVALQAWASGRPVVVPPVGDFPELLAQSGGVLARDNSTDSLVDAVRHLLTLREASGAGEAWEAALREKSAAYDWERVTQVLIGVYEAAAERRLGTRTT